MRTKKRRRKGNKLSRMNMQANKSFEKKGKKGKREDLKLKKIEGVIW